MKRITTIIILLLYLIPIVGISVSVHYCGSKIASVSILHHAEKCGCNIKKMKKDCCKETTKTYQIKDFQETAKQCTLNNIKVSENLHVNSFSIQQTSFTSLSHTYFKYKHPPASISSKKLFILNSAFLI